MGQFTGLFNGLEKAEIKAQSKPETAESEKRRSNKQTASAKAATAPSSAEKDTKNKLAAAQSNGSGSASKLDMPTPTRGKRSHPDYTQAPAFVRKETYKAVKIALLNEERRLDYSDLIEELLTAWLHNRK